MEKVFTQIDEELNTKNNEVRLRMEDKDKAAERKYLDINFPIDNLSAEERLLKPFKHLMGQQGKNIRQKAILSLNYWLRAPEQVENALYKICYLTHNCSLLVDDVQDRSILRRGIPCAHLIFGTARTMNSFNYFVGRCVEIISSLGDRAAVQLFEGMAAEFVRGQAMEVYWRERCICPTENDYKLMISRKTGAIFLFMLRLFVLYSNEDVDIPTLTRLITAFAFYFQINDDFINLWNEEYQQSKGFCEDITEGKFSFPIIYVINNFPEEGKVLKNILSQRTSDTEVLRSCRSVLEKCGALEYTRQAINKYRNTMIEEKNKLKQNPIFEELLKNEFSQTDHAIIV